MKIALAQLNYHIGNFEKTTTQIIDTLTAAKKNGADLVVFSELCICGYPARDFLEYPEFIKYCEDAANSIAKNCFDIACIIGIPVINPVKEGKDLYNAAYFIENGKIKAVAKKALLPTYDVFDEYRYFEPAKVFECIDFKGIKIALTICEDLWNLGDNPLYAACPMDELIKESPDVMINIAASPFSYSHDDERIKILQANCVKYNLPLFYVNHIGANTELIFDGGSLVLNNRGEVLDELPYFEEAVRYYDCKKNSDNFSIDRPVTVREPQPDIKQIYDALIIGIRDYFYKSGFKSAILGLSGGIDSAVVCTLACAALGPENVMGVLMPSKFSSGHSVDDALNLAQNLGCKQTTIPIKNISDAFETTMKPEFKDLPFNVAEENIQARARGVILMAMSNKFGYVLLNTSNKSEAAVGYGTLYGDMCGAISVLGDCYKMQVFELAAYINRDKIIIPLSTINKPPSAELRPDQKDSDSLPPYDVLDKLLFQYIELRKSSAALIAMGFEEQLVNRVLKMVNTAEFKRYQTPPILRISPKAFGMGRRMPIVGKYLS